MSEDGTTKDDVKVPDGETGEKITKLFREEEKDTSKLSSALRKHGHMLTELCRRYRLDCYG